VGLPNLLLAGAPKCGTTSVYDWLVAHPEISGGVEKELFYLMDQDDWKFNSKRNWIDSGSVGYGKLFPNDNKYLVDGTTLTLYQQSAIEYVTDTKPKILCFVREPAMRVYSTFKYLKNNRSQLSADISFGEYLKMVSEGCKFDGNNQLSGAIEQSKYVDYLDIFESSVGIGNIKVFVFEEFVRNPREGMADICDWLDIDDSFYCDFKFEKQNESLNIKSRTLNLWKEKLSPFVSSKKIKEIIKKIYYSVNSVPAEKFERNEDSALIEKLKERFVESNKALSSRYDVNVDSWK
jgi:hypothetical protein